MYPSPEPAILRFGGIALLQWSCQIKINEISLLRVCGTSAGDVSPCKRARECGLAGFSVIGILLLVRFWFLRSCCFVCSGRLPLTRDRNGAKRPDGYQKN